MDRSGQRIRPAGVAVILGGLVGALLVAEPARGGDDGPDGERLYKANCLICHGASGDGKGPAAAATDPAPTDFTRASFWNNTDRSEMNASMQNGVPGTSMRSFPNLGPKKRAAIIEYMESFREGGDGAGRGGKGG